MERFPKFNAQNPFERPPSVGNLPSNGSPAPCPLGSESTFCEKNKDFYFYRSATNDLSSLQRAHEFATARGGACLSTFCEDAWAALTYKCALEHIWGTNEVLLAGA